MKGLTKSIRGRHKQWDAYSVNEGQTKAIQSHTHIYIHTMMSPALDRILNIDLSQLSVCLLFFFKQRVRKIFLTLRKIRVLSKKSCSVHRPLCTNIDQNIVRDQCSN